MIDDTLKKSVKELENKLGRKLDLENETYVLQTPDAYVMMSIDQDENGENRLTVNVIGGQLQYVKTDKHIFSDLFVEGDEE